MGRQDLSKEKETIRGAKLKVSDRKLKQQMLILNTKKAKNSLADFSSRVEKTEEKSCS